MWTCRLLCDAPRDSSHSFHWFDRSPIIRAEDKMKRLLKFPNDKGKYLPHLKIRYDGSFEVERVDYCENYIRKGYFLR